MWKGTLSCKHDLHSITLAAADSEGIWGFRLKEIGEEKAKIHAENVPEDVKRLELWRQENRMRDGHGRSSFGTARVPVCCHIHAQMQDIAAIQP